MNLLLRMLRGLAALGAVGSIVTFAATSSLPGDDTLLAPTPVPSAEKPQGEVRILQRGTSERVVQTVLYSKVLRRVAGKIAEKEAGNWTEGAAGYEDSTRFVAALRELAANVNRLPRDPEASGDRRRGMLIELSASKSGTRLLLSGARVEEVDGEYRVVELHAPEIRLDPGDGYVRDNQRFIVMDAFSVDAKRADALLSGPTD